MKMTLKRFKALVAAYGTEVSRWPEAEREAALNLLQTNQQASEIFKSAAGLDETLGVLPQPEAADDAFLKRLATIPFAARSLGENTPTTFGEFMRGFFPARKLVPQGLGLAAFGAFGIWLGVTATAPEQNIVEIDPSQYLLENQDLEKDIEDLT
jgi:hypothetical protein